MPASANAQGFSSEGLARRIAEPSWALFGERHGKYLLLAPDYELLAEDEETAVKVLAAANGLAFRA